LVLALTATAFGQQKQEKSKIQPPMTEAQAKAQKAAARREQLNQGLFAAIDAQAVGSVVRLLAAGADVNARDRDGMTPLMRAALHGCYDLTMLLVRKGALVNTTDTFGVTALMQAAWAGHVRIVEALLASGADPNLQSILDYPDLKQAGVNALIGASMNGNLEVAKILLDQNARLNQQDAGGQTALMCASQGDYLPVVELLLSRGAKTEIKDQFGRTALTIATIYGNFDVVCALVTAGANVYTKDIHNKKPIVYASALDHDEIYKYLEAAMIGRMSSQPWFWR
jgi:hypothetical protein